MPSVRWWVIFLCTYLVPPEVIGPAVSFFSSLPSWFGAGWTNNVGPAWDITQCRFFLSG